MCPSFALPTPLPQHYHSSASLVLESRLGVPTQLAVIITSTVSTITGTNVEDSELLAVRISIPVYTSQAVCAWTFSTTVLPSSLGWTGCGHSCVVHGTTTARCRKVTDPGPVCAAAATVAVGQ